MARAIVANLGESSLKEQGPFVDLPKISVPNTTILKRAQCTDFANDLLPRFGVDRVAIQQIVQLEGESGPNGELVFKPINDVHDAVRFVGTVSTAQTAQGQYVTGSVVGDYIEITFYGTGLNVLNFVDANTRTVSVSVDGGSSSSVSLNVSSWSNVLASRIYSQNVPIQIVSGLSLGIHTVKITVTATNFVIYGYEVINSTSTIQCLPGSSYSGSQKLTNLALSTQAYASGFTNAYGTVGTRGGHVLIYQKADGTIAKDIRYTETASAFLSSASHTNEEVIRAYHWREFGAGRTDDFFSIVGITGSKSFTLDDGTTSLLGVNVDSNSIVGGGGDLLRIPANDGTRFIIFTFVGTGCDIIINENTSGSYVVPVTVDGTGVGNLTSATGILRTVKIASGLPYGTHTVKILTSSGTPVIHFQKFIVYGPTKPSLPAGCVELSDYYLMADYSAVSTYGNAYVVSTGVLRKMLIREALYSGTWAVQSLDPSFGSGFNVRSNTAASFVELLFFGTGINYRAYLSNVAYNWTFAIDGAAPTGSTFTYQGSGLTYTAGTGVLSGTAAGTAGYGGSLFQISGLTLGLHKLRVTFNSGGEYLYADDFDIITPVHSPKLNGPGVLQNALTVGSQGISDNRIFSTQKVKAQSNWANAVGVTSAPTSVITTLVPCHDLSVTIKTSGNPISIHYCVRCVADAAGRNMQTAIFVDGVQVSTNKATDTSAGNFDTELTDSLTVPLAPGVHKVDCYWLISAGTMTGKINSRNLTVREL